MIHISIAAAVFTVAAPAAAISLHSTVLRRANPLILGSFPLQCQVSAGCTEVVNMFNTCLLAKCICTTTNGKNLQACFECSWSNGETGQNVLNLIDDFNRECIIADVTLSVPTNTYSEPETFLTVATAPTTESTDFVAFPTQGPGRVTWGVTSTSPTATAATGTSQMSSAGKMAVGMSWVFRTVLVSVIILKKLS